MTVPPLSLSEDCPDCETRCSEVSLPRANLSHQRTLHPNWFLGKDDIALPYLIRLVVCLYWHPGLTSFPAGVHSSGKSSCPVWSPGAPSPLCRQSISWPSYTVWLDCQWYITSCILPSPSVIILSIFRWHHHNNIYRWNLSSSWQYIFRWNFLDWHYYLWALPNVTKICFFSVTYTTLPLMECQGIPLVVNFSRPL